MDSITFTKSGESFNTLDDYGLYISDRTFSKPERKVLIFDSPLHMGVSDVTDMPRTGEYYGNFGIEVTLTKYVKNARYAAHTSRRIFKDIHGKHMYIKFSNSAKTYEGTVIFDSYSVYKNVITVKLKISAMPQED